MAGIFDPSSSDLTTLRRARACSPQQRDVLSQEGLELKVRRTQPAAAATARASRGKT